MIAGLVKNSETVNSTTRLVYFVFIMVGMFGDLGMLGSEIKRAIPWTPYGAVKTMVSAALKTQAWNNDSFVALALTAGYAVLFSYLGIKYFRWNVK